MSNASEGRDDKERWSEFHDPERESFILECTQEDEDLDVASQEDRLENGEYRSESVNQTIQGSETDSTNQSRDRVHPENVPRINHSTNVFLNQELASDSHNEVIHPSIMDILASDDEEEKEKARETMTNQATDQIGNSHNHYRNRRSPRVTPKRAATKKTKPAQDDAVSLEQRLREYHDEEQTEFILDLVRHPDNSDLEDTNDDDHSGINRPTTEWNSTEENDETKPKNMSGSSPGHGVSQPNSSNAAARKNLLFRNVHGEASGEVFLQHVDEEPSHSADHFHFVDENASESHGQPYVDDIETVIPTSYEFEIVSIAGASADDEDVPAVQATLLDGVRPRQPEEDLYATVQQYRTMMANLEANVREFREVRARIERQHEQSLSVDQEGSIEDNSHQPTHHETIQQSHSRRNTNDVMPQPSKVTGKMNPDATKVHRRCSPKVAIVICLAAVGIVVLGLTLSTKTEKTNAQHSSSMSLTRKSFASTEELHDAVDRWLAGEDTPDSKLAAAYGYPIGKWDVSRITNFTATFSGACYGCTPPGRNPNASTFNDDISQWNVSNAQDMREMFANAKAFNGDLAEWDVSRVSDTSYMFKGASAFAGNLSSWDTSSVVSMKWMFAETDAFNNDLSNWNVSNVVNMNALFYNADAFDGDVSAWDVSRVEDASYMFASTGVFDGDLSDWNVSRVTDMSNMFHSALVFNGDLSRWDVSSVTNMKFMFAATGAFNGNISAWDVSNVETMMSMFAVSKAFDRDISGWDVSSVVDISSMFNDADKFGQNLCEWGDRLPSRAAVTWAFYSAGCPAFKDPDLYAAVPGPFCFNCTAR